MRDQVKAGIGWVEVGISNDDIGPAVVVRHTPWRTMLWDSLDSRHDMTDCRYVIRLKIVDEDVAQAIFKTPEQRAAIGRVVQQGSDAGALRDLAGSINVPLPGADSLRSDLVQSDGAYDVQTGGSAALDLYNTRRRVLLIECWYRDYSRQDQLDAGEMGDLASSQIRVAILTERDMLLDVASPFKHGRFPFVPVWCYRDTSDGLPYPPARRLKGPQDAYNTRVLETLRLAKDRRIMAEVGAFDASVMPVDEVAEEMASSDGVAIFANGALAGGKVREVTSSDKSVAMAQAAERDLMHMRNASGITSDNRGMDSNATSGRAILAKADQGSMLTAEIAENQAQAHQLIGELKLSLVEQYMTDPRTIRVPGEGGAVERMRINDGGRSLADMRAHFSIGEQAWKQSFAEAAFEQLMAVVSQLAGPAPQVVINILDLIFEMHPHLPRKSAIVSRIRDINGQTPPDGRITPEQRAKQEQAAKIAEANFRAEMAKLDADVEEARARGEKLGAEAVRTRLTAIYEAAQASQVAAQVPGVMPIADQLLASAGFTDLNGQGTGAVVPPQAVGQPIQAGQPLPELQQADGEATGIETMRADGVRVPQPMN